MQENRTENIESTLRNLTPQQFMALGGNTVVYIRHVKGSALTHMIPNAFFDEDEEFHLVVSADGSPLMVADTQEAVEEWLEGKPFGLVALH